LHKSIVFCQNIELQIVSCGALCEDFEFGVSTSVDIIPAASARVAASETVVAGSLLENSECGVTGASIVFYQTLLATNDV